MSVLEKDRIFSTVLLILPLEGCILQRGMTLVVMVVFCTPKEGRDLLVPFVAAVLARRIHRLKSAPVNPRVTLRVHCHLNSQCFDLI